MEYFHPEAMRPKERKSFETWHKDEVNKYKLDKEKLYYPVQELLKYCDQDVRILAQGFQKYRMEWMEQFPDMDPAGFLTFPQFNNALFRTHYMPKDSLALLPPQGFQMENNKNSKSCFAWLHCFKADLKAQGLEVKEERTGRKGFEVRICGAKVDALIKDSADRIHVLQFHGCYWHGCECIKEPKRRKDWQMIKWTTEEQSQRLQDLSTNPDSPYGPFIYHEIKECQFKLWKKQEHKHSKRIHKFLLAWSSEPLKPRDAFFGGRTNTVKHKVELTKPEESIQYVDFTSLYPSVQYGTDGQLWPLGHPKVYMGLEVWEEGPSLEESFGLWKVKVHPPQNLRHPVLPLKTKEKLLFPLCKTCSETLHQGACPHTKEQRAFTGTWFTEELKMAKKMGYQLETPVEIWDWPPEKRSPDLFRAMIRDQYKKKVISSPFKSKKELKEAMEELLQMGIQVTEEEFKPNPSMRALAKFSLNNIWGFLGKKGDQTTTEFITTAKEFYKIEEDRTKKLLLIFPIQEDLAMVQWKPKEERAGKHGNIVDALLTTAYGRLKLYSVLAAFSEQVLYFDTDSVFLHLLAGMEGPKTSSLLGELKDEVLDGWGRGPLHHLLPQHWAQELHLHCGGLQGPGQVQGDEGQGTPAQLCSL